MLKESACRLCVCDISQKNILCFSISPLGSQMSTIYIYILSLLFYSQTTLCGRLYHVSDDFNHFSCQSNRLTNRQIKWNCYFFRFVWIIFFNASWNFLPTVGPLHLQIEWRQITSMLLSAFIENISLKTYSMKSFIFYVFCCFVYLFPCLVLVR